MKHFLSCDWGTTGFRLRLAEAGSCTILAEERSESGIAATFNRWQATGNTASGQRTYFYLDVVSHHIKKMEEKLQRQLSGIKLIVSGMASSSIGIMEIPYAEVPVATDGFGFKIAFLAAQNKFDHDVLIISGLKSGNDVMRGEETQLVGCIDSRSMIGDELFILPGTHSKHITIKNNQITGFKTYMTGEFFELLSQKSILKNAVEAGSEPDDDDLACFKNGVKDAGLSNLLNSAFGVRVKQLFGVYNKAENFNYLSGLLIGTELNELKNTKAAAINLVCGGVLEKYYRVALSEIGLTAPIKHYPVQRADEAVVRGQYKISRQLNFLA